MHNPVSEYFRSFPQRFGDGWNRFWFTPSDPLTLCVLRVAAGLMALYLHFTLSFDLVAFFSADGLLPPHAVAQWAGGSPTLPGFPTPDRLSYLSYVTSPVALWVLHGIGFVVLAAFTLGLFTRYTSIAAVVIVLSYMHRGPMLVSYVEPVLAMVLFYLCLGPCGARLSLDSRWRRSRHPAPASNAESCSSSWATVATRLLQLHFSAFCFMMGLSKLAGGSGSVWWSGEAMWMLISRPDSRLIDLTWLAGHPFLIDVWTHVVVGFELAFPVVIWNRAARPIVLSLAVLVWGSLIPVTGLTTFYVMLIVASWSFVDPSSWLTLRESVRSGLGKAADAVPVPAIAEAAPQPSHEATSASREQSPSKSGRMARRHVRK
jgi:hypothetical protein